MMKFDTNASKKFQFLSQLHSGASASLVHLVLTTREFHSGLSTDMESYGCVISESRKRIIMLLISWIILSHWLACLLYYKTVRH